MGNYIASVSLIVPDYDQAISFYVGCLGFNLLEDTDLGNGQRWVAIRPAGAKETSIILKLAKTEQEKALIGQQAAGGVLLILRSDDFDRDYQAFKEKGVRFLEEPRREPYGKVVIFSDPFGHQWDLIQPV